MILHVKAHGQICFAIVLMGLSPIAIAQPSSAQALENPPKPITTETNSKGVRVIMPEVAPPPAKPVVPAPAQSGPSYNSAPVTKPAAQPLAPAPKRNGTAPTVVAPKINVTPVIKTCARPFAKTDLVLGDAATFDRMLKAKLRSGRRTVTLNITQPYGAGDAAPAPLAAWLEEIKSTGGIVAVKPYCEGGRGLFDFLGKLLNSSPKNAYKAARRYDAMLHVDAVDQLVTQVEFTPRAGG